MKRRLVPLLSAVAALALLAGSLPGGAGANSAPGDGSSQSRAAAVTPGAGLQLTPRVSILGLPLGLSADAVTTPLTTAVVTPIINALLATPNAVATGLANGLVGAGFSAQSGDGQLGRPASGYPACGQRGWDASNCYGPVAPTVTVPSAATVSTPTGSPVSGSATVTTAPLLALSSGVAQGYATGDEVGYVAGARVANPVFTLLGFPLGDLGVVTSSASCRTSAASCTATQSFSGGSLLGGKLALSLADGGPLLAKIGTTAVSSTAVPLDVGGFASTVTVDSNLATITVGLSLPQLLSALGLPDVLSTVSGLGVLSDDGSNATMTIKIGPGNVSRSSPASAWGLQMSVDLSVALKFKLLSVANLNVASVAITSTSTPPSLFDLKLAYSTATAGNLQAGWIPPTLV